MIDPKLKALASELSRRMGEECRKIMLESGMTQEEVKIVAQEAFK